MNFINLATMDSLHAAEQLADKLSQQGITSRTHDERDMQRFLFLTKPKGHYIVQIPEDSYVAAVTLIQELSDADDPICRHIFSCPECGSLAVEYPQFTRKYLITPLLLEWASNLGLFQKKFYCRKCHWMWLPVQTPITPRISLAREIQVAPPD